jgi:ribosomal protein S19
MKVLMDYYNVNRDTKSQWRKIKLAYIVVSPEFEGSTFGAYNGNSWVFATSVEVTPPLVNAAALTDTYFANTNAAGVCGYIDSFPKQFGTNCADGKVVAHYYIMGFRYDSVSDSAY